MLQLELFDYRRDVLFESENQIAHYYDVLKESEDSISYAEHINPKKGFAVACMDYEEYIDIKKNRLKAGVIFGLSAYWGIIILGTVITFN